MLQRRALGKYHSGGLWSNTCCSHPIPGETNLNAAKRRLMEEMGLECPLKELFTTIYRVDFDNGLSEHEFLHVFAGVYDQDPIPNPEEAMDWKFAGSEFLLEDIKENPDIYTYWLKLILRRVLEAVSK